MLQMLKEMKKIGVMKIINGSNSPTTVKDNIYDTLYGGSVGFVNTH